MSADDRVTLPAQVADLHSAINIPTWILLPENQKGLTDDDRAETVAVFKGILKPSEQRTGEKEFTRKIKPTEKSNQTNVARNSRIEKKVIFIEPTEIVEIVKESTSSDHEGMSCHCSYGDRSGVVWYSLTILMLVFLFIALVICIQHLVSVKRNAASAVMCFIVTLGIFGFLKVLRILKDFFQNKDNIPNDIDV